MPPRGGAATIALVEGLQFAIVDVFAHQPLEGNPLAVVADAERLSETVMRRVAREFNQSETTFLLPSGIPGADWRLRSFTPSGAEVFGAGHNSLGAWWWLAVAGRLPQERYEFHQEIGGRVLPVYIQPRAGNPTTIEMRHATPLFGSVYAQLETLAAALDIAVDDLESTLQPQVISTGAAHLLVAVRSRAVVDRVSPHAERLLAILRLTGAQGCYVFSLDPVERSSTAYARFFNPTVGIWEDPATGSAAGPLACRLVAAGVVSNGGNVVIEQGHAMGRPSRIAVAVKGDDIRIVGSAVVVAEGSLRVYDPELQ